jgi:hypothetical protein
MAKLTKHAEIGDGIVFRVQREFPAGTSTTSQKATRCTASKIGFIQLPHLPSPTKLAAQ